MYRNPLITNHLLMALTVGIVIGVLACKDGVYYG